jgi:acetyl-CoA carboxylase biotin carboxyl carrier protein
MEPEGLEEFIRTLIAIMQESELSELEVEREGVRVRLQKQPPARVTEVVTVAPAGTMAAARGDVTVPPAPTVPEGTTQGNLLEVTSPMVGVFYEAPAPDAEPFVKTGDEVEPETVVCIIEAMKVMNEIKAEASGRIADILVSNGEAVEFGQVLFLVEPL